VWPNPAALMQGWKNGLLARRARGHGPAGADGRHRIEQDRPGAYTAALTDHRHILPDLRKRQKPPLWQIRGQTGLCPYQLEKQLYFRTCNRSRVLGLCLLLLGFPPSASAGPPQLRAGHRSFLIPQIKQTSLLGLGSRFPIS